MEQLPAHLLQASLASRACTRTISDILDDDGVTNVAVTNVAARAATKKNALKVSHLMHF